MSPGSQWITPLQRLQQFTSYSWREAIRQQDGIVQDALAVLNRADLADFLHCWQEKVAVVIFLAGAGSRWIDSIRKAQAHGQARHIDIERPRCLALVEDVRNPTHNIPLAAYTLRVIQGIGRHYIVWRTHLPEIQGVAAECNLTQVRFVQQTSPGNANMLGHGDGLRQVLPELGNQVELVLALFGSGDVQVRKTIITTLLVLTALQKAEPAQRPWGLLPTTFLEKPVYPIRVNEQGMPIGFGHSKLLETNTPVTPAQSNIGVRAYCRQNLDEILSHFARFFHGEAGYRIPGNNTNEFALDNIDAYLAEQQRLRCLCIARPEEITPVKQWEDVEAYLAAQRGANAIFSNY